MGSLVIKVCMKTAADALMQFCQMLPALITTKVLYGGDPWHTGHSIITDNNPIRGLQSLQYEVVVMCAGSYSGLS